jgi:putative oxidoreductase
MPDSASFPEKWTPQLQSLARIVFGFLIVRHGMEQLFGYPEASGAARLSYEGVVELIAFPAGLLIILGLFTRPISLVLAVLYFVLYFVGPLQRGWFTHRNGGDPILLNAFFFLYLAVAGGGAWGLDKHERGDVTRTQQALGLLRIVAGCLFVMHGLEKLFSVGGGRIDRDIMTMRGLAGWLETVGGPLLVLGLLTRPVAFLLSGEMAVAYFRSWAPRGFWQSFQLPGMEASILFCYLFLMFWAAGPGAWSSGSGGGAVIKSGRIDHEANAPPRRPCCCRAPRRRGVNRPTPGIPLRNGKPNLNASARRVAGPRHPDLSGIWTWGP